MTQAQLGKLVSLGKHSISSFELDKNEPKDEIKMIFAKYFKVSVDYLLGLTNDPTPGWDKDTSYIRLPMNFSPQAKKEAEEYIQFLAQKYR